MEGYEALKKKTSAIKRSLAWNINDDKLQMHVLLLSSRFENNFSCFTNLKFHAIWLNIKQRSFYYFIRAVALSSVMSR